MFQTLKYIPAKILGIDGEFLGIIGFSLLGLLLVLTPFVASGHKREGRVDRVVLFGAIVVIYMIVLTTLGYSS
jgi:uncharacterized membrane protein